MAFGVSASKPETVMTQEIEGRTVRYDRDPEVGGYWIRTTSDGSSAVVSDGTLLDALLFELANGIRGTITVTDPPQP